MIYNKANPPEMLEQGDLIDFELNCPYEGRFVLRYRVKSSFLHVCREDGDDFSNSAIFKALGISKGDFCNQIYGYSNHGGDWPCYKADDYPAATRVTRELLSRLEGTMGKVNVEAQVKRDIQNIMHTIALYGGVVKTPANLEILQVLAKLNMVKEDKVGFQANPGIDFVRCWNWSKTHP